MQKQCGWWGRAGQLCEDGSCSWRVNEGCCSNTVYLRGGGSGITSMRRRADVRSAFLIKGYERRREGGGVRQVLLSAPLALQVVFTTLIAGSHTTSALVLAWMAVDMVHFSRVIREGKTKMHRVLIPAQSPRPRHPPRHLHRHKSCCCRPLHFPRWRQLQLRAHAWLRSTMRPPLSLRRRRPR